MATFWRSEYLKHLSQVPSFSYCIQKTLCPSEESMAYIYISMLMICSFICSSIHSIRTCLQEVKTWMTRDTLKINSDKTIVLPSKPKTLQCQTTTELSEVLVFVALMSGTNCHQKFEHVMKFSFKRSLKHHLSLRFLVNIDDFYQLFGLGGLVV